MLIFAWHHDDSTITVDRADRRAVVITVTGSISLAVCRQLRELLLWLLADPVTGVCVSVADVMAPTALRALEQVLQSIQQTGRVVLASPDAWRRGESANPG